MKTLVFAAIFIVVAVCVASAEAREEGSHTMVKRQIVKPQTIFVKPPPGCGMPFWECTRRCQQRGHLSGGYCTMTGCVCLR
ncbi:unnamed protein product [Leptosia nina]|uniref:Uncharacterized protein n=1 Tax=Leptosia nina TaxID=320188 RepID=A0AAV1JQ42_9NEOP